MENSEFLFCTEDSPGVDLPCCDCGGTWLGSMYASSSKLISMGSPLFWKQRPNLDFIIKLFEPFFLQARNNEELRQVESHKL